MRINIKLYAGIAAVFLSLAACSANVQAPQQRNNQPDKPASQSGPAVRAVSSLNRTGVHVVADPDSTLVLVNKYFKLPDNYVPKQLVYPNVPFIYTIKSELFKMRLVAAKALERMFAAAKKDGIQLAGVSAYRSYATQTVLFNDYVKKDGETKALTYSARPGTSEHETGLAIDVSGINGQYAATEAFANTPEAAWLALHARDYGFIVRYPKGKEAVTGYVYEAWHLRYVGLPASKKMVQKGLTLEEYLGHVPVTR